MDTGSHSHQRVEDQAGHQADAFEDPPGSEHEPEAGRGAGDAFWAPARGSGRPVLDALELLGRRWALRLVWELRRDALGFADIRVRTGMGPSTLSLRLRELDRAGVVERDPSRRYRLSGSGRELGKVLFELNRWAERERARRTVGLISEG